MRRKPLDPNFRYIAEFTEKHDSTRFVILNDEELDAVCLYMLQERLRQGYWYHKPKEPEQPTYTKEEAENLKGPAREAALQELKTYTSAKRRHEDNGDEWDQIQKTVKNKDGKEAFNILRSRSDHEYERFELHIAHRLSKREAT